MCIIVCGKRKKQNKAQQMSLILVERGLAINTHTVFTVAISVE
jgi:hypothetical protein